MDSTAYSKMLLDSMAFGCRTGACATTARVARPNAENRMQFAWGVASGRYRQFADGPVECGATPLWLPYAIGSRSAVTAAGFNRRIRKTVRTVVWEGDGAQSPSLDPIRDLCGGLLTQYAVVGIRAAGYTPEYDEEPM